MTGCFGPALQITRGDLADAWSLIRNDVVRTPVLPLAELSDQLGLNIFAKAEVLQRTGSFKFRGAISALRSLPSANRERGVITYSAGNHGRGVAEAGRRLGVPVMVVMPEDATAVKVEGVRQAGGYALLDGRTLEERRAKAEALAVQERLAIVPPFDDLHVVLGQSTIGAELAEQLPDVDAVLVPVGGGGLIAGVALALKARRPSVKIVGVEPVGKPAAFLSCKENRLVQLDDVATVAESLRSPYIGRLNWEIIRRLVDEIVLVKDESLLEATRSIASDYKLVVEPAGVAGIAALLEGWRPVPDARRVVVVLSGGNVDLTQLAAPGSG